MCVHVHTPYIHIHSFPYPILPRRCKLFLCGFIYMETLISLYLPWFILESWAPILLSLLHHSCFLLFLSEILFSSLEHLWWLYSSGILILFSLIWLMHISTSELVSKLPGCRDHVLLIFYPSQIAYDLAIFLDSGKVISNVVYFWIFIVCHRRHDFWEV